MRAIKNLRGFSACREHLNLYSPYGEYRFYRASKHVQYSNKSTTPVVRKHFTDPQCFYSKINPLFRLWLVQILQ